MPYNCATNFNDPSTYRKSVTILKMLLEKTLYSLPQYNTSRHQVLTTVKKWHYKDVK